MPEGGKNPERRVEIMHNDCREESRHEREHTRQERKGREGRKTTLVVVVVVVVVVVGTAKAKFKTAKLTARAK
jgi:hypothetical protein